MHKQVVCVLTRNILALLNAEYVNVIHYASRAVPAAKRDALNVENASLHITSLARESNFCYSAKMRKQTPPKKFDQLS